MEKPSEPKLGWTMLTKKKIAIASLALVIIVVIAGVVIWQQSYRTREIIAGPVSIIDDLGRNVTITKYPLGRIVSLAPSCTEILFALGLGEKVVGVDTYSDYPPEVIERVNAGNLTIVGSFSDISIETVLSLKPDLILATGGVQRTVAESLEGLGLPVVVLYPTGFNGTLADISLAGKATGQIDEAKALVADMQKKAQEIVDKTRDAPRPRVYVEYFFDGGYWTFGSESYTNELISTAGGVNVFANVTSNIFATSTEEVVKANPEIIIISKGIMATSCGLTPEVIKERPSWSEIYAVQNDQIYVIDESIISRGGPRLIDGLEELAKLIHPELFS
jgi:iron complex transport system substrate-binding protein